MTEPDAVEPDSTGTPEPEATVAAPPVAPVGRKRRWLLPVLAGLGATVLVFLQLSAAGERDEQEKLDQIFASRDFVLPDSLDGVPRHDTEVTRAAADAITKGMAKTGGRYTTSAATYGGEDSPAVHVIVTRPDHALSRHAQEGAVRGFLQSLREQGGLYRDIDPGPLGGTVTCARVQGGSTCLVVDAVGFMTLVEADNDLDAKVRHIREVVEAAK